MIRHCALFRWNDDVDDALVAEVGARLDELAALPVVASYRHGTDLGLGPQTFDYAVTADFATEDDYRAYVDDEAHQRLITELLLPNLADRAALQFTFET